jgi:hypothetical protein
MAVECGAHLHRLTAELDALPRPVDREQFAEWVRRFVAVYHDDGPVIRVWMDNRDADPLMQSLASDSLGPLTRSLAALADPETSEVVGDPMVGLGMIALLERLNSYLGDIDAEAVVSTATRLLHAVTARP